LAGALFDSVSKRCVILKQKDELIVASVSHLQFKLYAGFRINLVSYSMMLAMQALNTAHGSTSFRATIKMQVAAQFTIVPHPAHNASSTQRHRLVKQVFVQKNVYFPQSHLAHH